MRHLPLLLLPVLLAACGGKPAAKDVAHEGVAPADAVPDAGAESPLEKTSAQEEPRPAGLPKTCANGASPCVPEPAFVKRLCNAPFFDVALTMFAKESPFTRMYLKGEVEAWNADGGASARTRLAFDEEVLALRRRGPAAGGIVVGSGGAGWLVLRWDGNCYSLEEGELTEKRPPQPKGAPLPFRLYEAATRDALLKNAKILAAYKKRGKECKGAISGDVSRACEQADTALSVQIVTEVRGGLTVPVPAKLP
jgi:hypothetical protein